MEAPVHTVEGTWRGLVPVGRAGPLAAGPPSLVFGNARSEPDGQRALDGVVLRAVGELAAIGHVG